MLHCPHCSGFARTDLKRDDLAEADAEHHPSCILHPENADEWPPEQLKALARDAVKKAGESFERGRVAGVVEMVDASRRILAETLDQVLGG